MLGILDFRIFTEGTVCSISYSNTVLFPTLPRFMKMVFRKIDQDIRIETIVWKIH